MRRTGVFGGFALTVLIAAAAAGPFPAASRPEFGPYKPDRGPFPVGSADLELRDAERGRNLQIRVTYPEADGRLPVVLWSHGATGSKDMYRPLVDHWASHGYVCLQPNHSDSRAFGAKRPNSPEVFRDWRSRPADISFLIDSLERIGERVAPLKRRLDAGRIGVGGHSFGAHTAQLTAGATLAGPRGRESLADPRPRAFLLLSPQGTGTASAGLDEDSWRDIDRPYIVITGTRDLGRNGQDWQWRLHPYAHAAPGPKYLLVIDEAWHGFGGLVGGETFRGAGPDNPDHRRYVTMAAMAFWDAYLKEDPDALAFLRSEAMARLSGGRARLETKDSSPSADAVGDQEAPERSEHRSTERPKEQEFGPDTRFKTALEDADWRDEARQRTVPVRIHAPAPAHGHGPYPIVVFSHGGGESREAFTFLGEHWAGRGYIAVFLTHEGSDRRVVKAQGLRALGGDLAPEARPLDMRFVIDRVLSPEPGSALLEGRVDPGRLAVAGQCAGSTTALALVGLNARFLERGGRPPLEPRAKCALALSPQPAGGPMSSALGMGAGAWANIRVPTLIVTGTRDFNWVPQVRRDPSLTRMAFDGLPPGEHFLVEIRGAEHNAFTDSAPYYPARTRDPRHHDWIRRATTAMLDAYLRDDPAARDWLRTERLEAETNGECLQDNKLAGGSGRDATAVPSPPPRDPMAPRAAAPESAAAKGAVAASPARTVDFTAVDAFMEASLGRLGGGCCLLLIRGDEVVYRRAFGTFGPDQVVPIASASKWISGGVVMALADEGLFSLDDPASRYLPDFSGDKAGITVRQLFSHTHGLPQQPEHHRNTRLTMGEAVGRIAALPLLRPPGTALIYGGTGMQAAGRICEIAAGRPWTDVFEERIGRPLGMTSTDYFAFGRTENPNVAGSVRTCMDNYGAFLRMLLNGGVFEGRRVLSANAVRTMLTNQTGDVPIVRSACQPYAAIDPEFGRSRYGIGCWLEGLDPETGLAREATSGGAFGCMPFLDLGRNIGGVFLPYHRSLRMGEDGTPYNDAAAVFLELRPLIRTAFDGRPRALATPPLPPAAAIPAPGARRAGQWDRTAGAAGDPAQQASMMLRLFDRDRDGALSRTEAPERLRPAFSRLDRDRDGRLTRAELLRLLEMRGVTAAPTARRPVPPGEAQPAQAAEQAASHAPGPYGVGATGTLDLRDDERGRAVPLRVTYPVEGEGHPVILFSHCVNGSREDFQPLIENWVSHGYVCLQPDHADSRLANAGGPPLDWRNRARDLTFLLDSLDDIIRAVPALAGRVDTSRIGAGGHLIGAYAASLLVGMQVFPGGAGTGVTFRDDRVRAALLLSPQGRGQGLTERSWAAIDRPMLVAAGGEAPSRRTGNPPEWRAEPFDFSPPGDRYLLWLDGLGNDYAGLATGRAGDPGTAATIMETTRLFWDAHLKDNAGAREALKNRVKVRTP